MLEHKRLNKIAFQGDPSMQERVGRRLGLIFLALGLASVASVARAQDYVSGGATLTTSWTQLSNWFNAPKYPPDDGTTSGGGATSYSQSAGASDSGSLRGSWITLPQNPGLGGFLSEARIGVFDHDSGPVSSATEGGFDVAFEFLFNSPDFLKYIFSPRPHLGASIHSKGDTNQGYLGLTWTADIYESFFVELAFGGVVHDGDTDIEGEDRNDLGCSLLFRGALTAGVLIGGRHSLSLSYNHISNGGFCVDNDGQDNLGLLYGYRF